MPINNQTVRDTAPEYMRRLFIEPPLLLKNFSSEEVMEFLSLGAEERFLPDEVIINEPEFVNAAYLIVEGRIGVENNDVRIAVLSAGDFMGETFLFNKKNRMDRVISDEESLLLRFERSETLDFFRRKPVKLFHIFTRNIIGIQQKKINTRNSELLQLKKRLAGDSD